MLTTDFLRAALALNVLGALMGWWGYAASDVPGCHAHPVSLDRAPCRGQRGL